MHRAIFFAVDRDDLFIPFLKALYPSAVEREIIGDATLRGYHELVMETPEEAAKLAAAADAIDALWDTLEWNDPSETVPPEVRDSLRRIFHKELW